MEVIIMQSFKDLSSTVLEKKVTVFVTVSCTLEAHQPFCFRACQNHKQNILCMILSDHAWNNRIQSLNSTGCELHEKIQLQRYLFYNPVTLASGQGQWNWYESVKPHRGHHATFEGLAQTVSEKKPKLKSFLHRWMDEHSSLHTHFSSEESIT